MKWLFCIFMPKFSWIKELHFKVIPSLFHDIYFNFMRVSCLVSWTFRRSILNDTLISSRKIERILKYFNKRSRWLVFKVRHLSAWIINEWMNEMKWNANEWITKWYLMNDTPEPFIQFFRKLILSCPYRRVERYSWPRGWNWESPHERKC